MKVLPLEFDPARFERGGKYALDLVLSTDPVNLELPVLLARGGNPGKTLVATAAVHGDEYEGVRAIYELFEQLETAEMAGDFLASPVANPPAFWNGTRTSPLDGGNLARVFPGDLEGTPTQVIAYHLGHCLIARADFYIDLHSGGVKCVMPSMIGFASDDPRARAAAEAFGAEVLWSHPSLSPGRTVSFARERNIPWLYTEARGAGRIHPDDLRMMKRGLVNLMCHLRILSGEPERRPIRWRLYCDADTDQSLAATRRGFLLIEVELLQRVRKGQLLGRLIDLHGETIESYHAPEEGIVGFVRQFPVVEPGDPLFLLTQTIE